MEKIQDQKASVLYVDDIMANLMLFEASFETSFQITTAESGSKALELFREQEFDVVVSDQNMPGMSGTELLEIIARDYPLTMRFMITAYTDYETVVESINKGQVYGYFNKPYNIEEVRMTISQSLDVRDLKVQNLEMIKKLEKSNKELLEIDKSKISFLSGITNEIRSPINKIMTAVHMIKDKIDSKELTESLQLLDLSLGRLESFSEAAKLLVRLQDSDNSIKMEHVSPKELIEVGIIEKRDVLINSGLKYSVDDQSDNAQLEGEFELLLTSFMIILELVAQHVEGESELLITLARGNGKLSIDILSKNSSYSKKEIGLLSNLFSDEENQFNKDFRMELILTQIIITNHHGSINFRVDEDKSALIQLVLPVV